MSHPPRHRPRVPTGHRIFSVEDRYLPSGWHGRTEDTDGLIQIRTMLVDAYRRGQVRPADVDAVSARVEWVDARIGRLARVRIERRRAEAAARVWGAVALLLMVVVAAVVLVAFGASRFLLGTCGVALLATVVILAVSVRPATTLIEEETGESYLADL
jgi:hypothetical protein